MEQLSVPGEGEDISLFSISPDLSDDSTLHSRDEEEISVSDIETIDSAADFKLEVCYDIFYHLKKVIGWTSPFLSIIDIIVVTSVYVSIITATFLLTFHLTYPPVLAVFYASDGIFLIHLLFIGFVALSPITAWSTPSQLTFRQQCRFYCLIDLVTVIPFELIFDHLMTTKELQLLGTITSNGILYRNINYVALGRLNRLFRVYRLARFFNSKKNDVIMGTRFSDILSAACALTLLIHISACIWYWLGCKPFNSNYSYLNICWVIEGHKFVNATSNTIVYQNFEYHPVEDKNDPHGWTLDVYTVGGDDKKHFSFLYIISAYWATSTALSVGYGDYRGLNFNEIRFSLLVMLFGSAITNGLVVGSLTSLLTNINSQRASFAHRLMIITRYLQENKYSNDLSETIQGFYEYMWFKKKGHSTHNIYDALPPSLQSEICLSVNHCALSKSPMFRDLDEGFLRSIALKIQSHFYLPGQIVVNKGTVSRCMYYIVRGELDVLSDHDNCTPVAVLRPGKLFGEVNLVLNFARTATIRAASHCDLLILNQHDVTSVLMHYPETRLAMWKYVISIFETDFNEAEDSTKQPSPATIVDVRKGSLVTTSERFMPTLSPTVESEERLGLSKGGSSAKKDVAAVKGREAEKAPQHEKASDSRFPAISVGDRNKYDGDTVPRMSSIPVFKDSSILIRPVSTLSTSLSSQTTDRGSSSGVRGLSRPSLHVAGSSRKVATSETVMQKGDEPIPAFEKPDELHHGASSHRNMHFDWKETKPDGQRKNMRRPTMLKRPKGMSEVKLGQNCVALKSDASPHGISWLKQLVHRIKEPHIQEDSTFDNTWKTCVCVVVVVQWFLYLYHASFQEGYSWETLMLSYCLDAVHLADLIISMMTVVITPRQTYETYRQIFLYRAGTVAFYMDLVAVLPLDIICLPFIGFMEASRRSQLLTICKLNKLVKAWVIYHRFRFFEDQLYIPIKALRPIETMVYIFMGVHLSACVWYMDANFGHILVDKVRSDEWMQAFFTLKGQKKTIDHIGLNQNNSAYILSLYWAAATMSTTGYGDIVASSLVEYCISIFTMVLGLILFSYSLASYASLLTNLDRPKVQFQSIVFAMEQFMTENRLDKLLCKRVLRYMDVQWEAYDGLIMPGKPSLLHDLPEALQQDLAADGIVQLLDSVPLFHGTDATFRQELSSRCSRYLFPPNELVLYSGDLGRDMYIIIRGYCESFLGKRQKLLGVMGPGEYFGEAGMLYGLPRPAHVITRTHCSLLAIPHGEFQRIMKKFPTVNMEIRDLQDNAAILRTVKLNHARVWRLSKDLPPSSDTLFPQEEPQSFTMFPEKDASEEYRRPFSELGRLGSPLACLLMPRTVRPDGRLAVQLECFRIAIIMLLVIVTPLHITLAWTSFSMYALGILFDIVAIAYIYVRLHWAYFDETSTLITHPVATAHNYLVSAFLLDLIGCFPFDLIAMLFFQGNIYDNLHVIVLFRCNRMIQWYEIAWAFYIWERRLLFRSGIIKVIKYLSYFGLYVHIISCIWAYMACPALFSRDGDSVKGIEGRIREYTEFNKVKFLEIHENCRIYSWYSTSKFADHIGDSFEMYMISMLYTLEMIASVGYGDMTPQSRGEYMLAIIVMIHGVIFFGFVIASVTASFVNADITRANFNERVKELAKQMGYEVVPESLQKKVLKHVEYAFFRSQGMEAHALFTNLPPSIRGDVAIVLFEDLISSVPIFETIDRNFHRMLAMCLKESFFLEGETVIFVGDIGEEMYFIHRGTCDVIDDDEKVITSLGPGRFFGEVSVMFSVPRTATIKARTNADLFVLTKNDLHDVLENYPDINREIERIAIKGLKNAGERKVSKDEHQAMPRTSESGGRRGSMTDGSLMEARHGRKHKTHHRRSFAVQLVDALIPHSHSKDQHGRRTTNHQTLADEYKALLQSEEKEQRQKEFLVQKRRSSKATQLKGLIHNISSSHATTTGPGKVDDNAKTGVSTEGDDKYKKADKSEADKTPKVERKLKAEDKSDEDGKAKVDSKHKVGDKNQVNEKQKLENMPKVVENQQVENEPKVEGNAQTLDEMDKSTPADQSRDPEMSKKEIDASESHSLQTNSRNLYDLPGPLNERSSTLKRPQLPPIGSKHMSKIVPVSEENIKEKDPAVREVSNNNMPSINITQSDIARAANKNPFAEGNTVNRAKEHDKYVTNRTEEDAGGSVDESGVRSAESGSQPVQGSGTVHQMFANRHTGAYESSANVAPVSAAGIENSAQYLSDPSNTSDASKVSISSAVGDRSEFRPPHWLDACFQRINRLTPRTVSSDFTINPESSLLLLFDLSLAILGAFSTMLLFYQLAFVDFNKYIDNSLLGISLVYTINIYIRMHTAYYDNYGDLVCDQITVRRKYMHRPTGFLIDVLSALPIGLLMYIHPESRELKNAVHKIRFVQLVRFYAIFNFFRCWERVLNAPILLLRSLRDVGFLLMLLHVLSCFWYMAACPAGVCIKGSWVEARRMMHDCNSTNHERYVNAVYFITATMTSTGYGDIHPTTIQEVIVCNAVIVIGKFAIGLIIGDLASTLSNLEVARVDMETMLSVIVNQMKDQSVPNHLQERVRHHVEYDWLRNRGHNLKDLLQAVPYCLRMEVFESIYGNQLRSISVFESASDYVIRRLSALCEQHVFLPGDFITKRGDIGTRVYIVRRGSVLVYRTSRAQPEYFLYSGSIYGDVQIVYPTIPYEHHLVADYPSDVLVINQADIQLLLADNPHFFFRVRRYIQKKYPDLVHDKRPSMAVKV